MIVAICYYKDSLIVMVLETVSVLLMIRVGFKLLKFGLAHKYLNF